MKKYDVKYSLRNDSYYLKSKPLCTFSKILIMQLKIYYKIFENLLKYFNYT